MPDPTPAPAVPSASPSVLIIGSGFGGIAAAIELGRGGYRDVTILEAASGLGGTWHHNTYPGAACDVPSALYSYSYARGRNWSRLCSPQSEILGYLQEVARRYGIDRLVRPDSPVAGCDWDDAAQRWTATTDDGRTFTAQVLIVATGQLHQPATPALPGIETFAGHAFHSARWDHGYNLAGKRVAVIGTGASAVQFVPEIAKEAASLTVFQRTGNWFMGRRNLPYSPRLRAFLNRAPGLPTIQRAVVYQYLEHITRTIRHPKTYAHIMRTQSWLFMRWQLRGDPELRRRLWPDYTFGCKRVLFSSYFLKSLRRPNVDLVTDRIARVVPEGVVTEDGTLHPVDCLIYATGFRTTDFMLPMQITAGERSLAAEWAAGAHAHLGITVPGFPSLFLMYGPNTNTSGGSILVFLEAQARYVRTALDHLRATGATSIAVKLEVSAASDAALQARFGGTAWLGCDSWYRADGGRIVSNWPGYMREYRAQTRSIDPAEFDLVPERA